jgi:glycosyltransferase involved in cell wall biosynthesis
MELVSVLIPTYNMAQWIRQSIESIINQTYTNLQIIIVDDGSSDNTEEIVDSISDNRILFLKKKHTGLPGSLNYGLNRCDGNYVLRIDADDYSALERVQIQLNYLLCNKDYGVVGSNYFLIDSKNKVIGKTSLPINHEHIIDQLPRKCCLSHGTLLFRKDLVTKVGGYNENKITVEDWDLYLRLIDKTKFHNLSSHLVYVRKHNANISNHSEYFNMENEIVPVAYYNKILNLTNNKTRLAKAHFDLGYFYYYENKFEQSIDLLTKAVKMKPFKLQYLRYFLFAKYFNRILSRIREKGWNKYWDFLRRLDKSNYFFRSKY